MKTTYENLGITEETSGKGSKYKALNIRKTVINNDGVVVELFVSKSFPVKGVEYKTGEHLKMDVVTINSRSGFMEVSGLNFIPVAVAAVAPVPAGQATEVKK